MNMTKEYRKELRVLRKRLIQSGREFEAVRKSCRRGIATLERTQTTAARAFDKETKSILNRIRIVEGRIS